MTDKQHLFVGYILFLLITIYLLLIVNKDDDGLKFNIMANGFLTSLAAAIVFFMFKHIFE